MNPLESSLPLKVHETLVKMSKMGSLQKLMSAPDLCIPQAERLANLSETEHIDTQQPWSVIRTNSSNSYNRSQA